MKKLMYAMRDIKAEEYSVPFFADSDAIAMREVDYLVNYEQTMLSAYPADYEMYVVGEYDTVSGEVIEVFPYRLVCRCAELVRKEVANDGI